MICLSLEMRTSHTSVVHCVASGQSRYFVMVFLNVPLAVGLDYAALLVNGTSERK